MLHFKFYLSYKHSEIGGQVLMRDVLFGQGRDCNMYLFSHRNSVATDFAQKYIFLSFEFNLVVLNGEDISPLF